MADRTGGRPVVIVGGGLAGGNAAVTLRQEGYRGPVVLISREPGVPFGRPPLSKTYLRSEEDLDGWFVKPASWYEEHDVERPGQASVLSVDAAAHTVLLDSGRELAYREAPDRDGRTEEAAQDPRRRTARPPLPAHESPTATRSSAKHGQAGTRS